MTNRRSFFGGGILSALFPTSASPGEIQAGPKIRKYRGYFVRDDGTRIEGKLTPSEFTPGEEMKFTLTIPSSQTKAGEVFVRGELVDQDGFHMRLTPPRWIYSDGEADITMQSFGHEEAR